jgi:hypothetical protein
MAFWLGGIEIFGIGLEGHVGLAVGSASAPFFLCHMLALLYNNVDLLRASHLASVPLSDFKVVSQYCLTALQTLSFSFRPLRLFSKQKLPIYLPHPVSLSHSVPLLGAECQNKS